MDEKLIQRLESAVSRLEALSTGFHPAGAASTADAPGDAALDPSVVAFSDLIEQYVVRLSGAAEVIGGQVLEVTKLVQEAFAIQKELLIKLKQTQVRSLLCCVSSSFFCASRKCRSEPFRFWCWIGGFEFHVRYCEDIVALHMIMDLFE